MNKRQHKDVVLAFRLSPALARKVDGMAAMLGVGRADILRTLVKTAEIKTLPTETPVGTLAVQNGTVEANHEQPVAQ